MLKIGIIEEDVTDERHIPNIGFSHWIARSDLESINTSEADHNKRNFHIEFFLEDTRARTSYVYASVPQESSFNIVQTDYVIDFLCQPNEDGYFNKIIAGLSEESAVKAFERTSAQVLPMLSVFSHKYRRPFHVRAIWITDLNHKAKWCISPFAQKLVEIKISPSGFKQHHPLGAMFSIYREGMNSISDSHRFLCFFKIFEAWKMGKSAFKNTRVEYENAKGNKLERPKRKITKLLLSGAFNEQYHDCFLNKKFTECFDSLNAIRDFVAHPFIDKKVDKEYFINFDDPQHLEFISAMSNLVERISTKILDDEIEILSSIDEQIKTHLNHK